MKEGTKRSSWLSFVWFACALALPSSPLLAVDCSSANITLDSQAEVDAFQTTYGGGGTCDTITGFLSIQGTADVQNLDGLAALVSVGGSLAIGDNAALTDLGGLAALNTIGGPLLIATNSVLTNLDGLSALTSVGGGFVSIAYNPALANVNGLSALTSVSGDLYIAGNDTLANLDGLSALTGVGGYVWIDGNPALTNLDGLGALAGVGTDLNLLNNGSLADCTGLRALVDDVDDPPPGPGPGGAGIPDIGGDVTIFGNLIGCNSILQILGLDFDLALSVVDSPDPVLAGSGSPNLDHTFTVTKTGPSEALAVTVDITASLPAGVSIFDWSATAGAFDGATWSLGDVTANGTVGELTVRLTVDATASVCSDCIWAEGVVAAENGADTNPANDTAVNPTSIETAASAPTSFLTTLAFTNGHDGSITVTIACNNGVPLEQSFAISPGAPVDFVVDLLDFVDPLTDCEISLAEEDGYTASVLANGVDTGGSCLFAGAPAVGEAPFDLTVDRDNSCAITAAPVPSIFEVEKRWEFMDDDTIERTAEIEIYCAPASWDTGASFGRVTTFVTVYGDDSFALQFYPSPSGGSTCFAVEDDLDSAVESDGGCSDGTDFQIGDESKGCTITNTVFFEGIPTLSHYSLVILALLTLGVGLVGLRRYA